MDFSQKTIIVLELKQEEAVTLRTLVDKVEENNKKIGFSKENIKLSEEDFELIQQIQYAITLTGGEVPQQDIETAELHEIVEDILDEE